MDGLLVIDKPVGPTSHDVVARMRRVLGERHIGHTGTLDPAASGVLPLVIGRATRLARFLSAGTKSYEAVVRFGVATETFDAENISVAPGGQLTIPTRGEIEDALEHFRGTYLQQPPVFSAKKIAGRRSYTIARGTRSGRYPQSRRSDSSGPADSAAPAESPNHQHPAPVLVTAHRVEIVSIDADLVTLRVDCSAGFYVRALAHDLGQRLGVGAHLYALRRIASAGFTLNDALPLADAEHDPQAARQALVPLAAMLPQFGSVVLTEEGIRRAAHGRDIGAEDVERSTRAVFGTETQADPSSAIRLLDQEGRLIGIAEPGRAPGLLHPSVVLM